MFTEEEKGLLKQAIDLTMSNIATMITKTTKEDERKGLRKVNNDYFNLITKIDETN